MLAGKGMKRIHRICSGTVGSAHKENPAAKNPFYGRQGANNGEADLHARQCLPRTAAGAKTALQRAGFHEGCP